MLASPSVIPKYLNYLSYFSMLQVYSVILGFCTLTPRLNNLSVMFHDLLSLLLVYDGGFNICVVYPVALEFSLQVDYHVEEYLTRQRTPFYSSFTLFSHIHLAELSNKGTINDG